MKESSLHYRKMETLPLFAFVLILFSNGEISNADNNVRNCPSMEKFEKTPGKNFKDPMRVVDTGEYFGTILEDGDILIFNKEAHPIQKMTYPGTKFRAVSRDRLQNVLVVDGTSHYTLFIPETFDSFSSLTPTSSPLTGDTFGCDEGNTIYAVSKGKIVSKPFAELSFRPYSKLSAYRSVSYIAMNRDDDTLYFVSDEKPNKIVNGNTKQVMLETPKIKSIYSHVDTSDESKNALYFLDGNCELYKLSTYRFKVGQTKPTKVMKLKDCVDGQRFMISYEKKVLVFDKKKIYDVNNSSGTPCVSTELSGSLQIVDAAINDKYILLATTNYFYRYKWRD